MHFPETLLYDMRCFKNTVYPLNTQFSIEITATLMKGLLLQVTCRFIRTIYGWLCFYKLISSTEPYNPDKTHFVD